MDNFITSRARNNDEKTLWKKYICAWFQVLQLLSVENFKIGPAILLDSNGLITLINSLIIGVEYIKVAEYSQIIWPNFGGCRAMPIATLKLFGFLVPKKLHTSDNHAKFKKNFEKYFQSGGYWPLATGPKI